MRGEENKEEVKRTMTTRTTTRNAREMNLFEDLFKFLRSFGNLLQNPIDLALQFAGHFAWWRPPLRPPPAA